MVLANGLTGTSCTLSRLWGVLCKPSQASACLCVLCMCAHSYGPSFASAAPIFTLGGSRFILDFFFSLYFLLPVMRSLTHCTQVYSACLSAGLSCLQSTPTAQVFSCEFACSPNTFLPWMSFLWTCFLLCHHFVLPFMQLLFLGLTLGCPAVLIPSSYMPWLLANVR